MSEIKENELKSRIEDERFRLDKKKNFYTKTEKQLMINERISKLKEVCKNLDNNLYSTIEDTIESLAFMSVELKDLAGVISENGQIETYRNGAYQTGYKQSAASQSFNAMEKSYLAKVKFLVDIIGTKAAEKDDELMNFIRNK